MARSLASDLRAIRGALGRVFGQIPGWVAGLVVGIQSVVLGYLVVWVLAVATMVLPAGQSGTWQATTDVAANIWLMAHGMPVATEVAVFTLIPWGFTIVCAAVAASIAWRFSVKSWGCWVVAVACYTCVVGFASVARTTEVSWRAVAGALMMSAAVVAVGMWRAHGAEFGLLGSLPASVRTGMRVGLGAVALSMAAAAVLGLGFALRGRDVMASMVAGLDIDPVAGVGVALAMMSYVPTVAAWLLGWLSGASISVGDARFSPAEYADAELPIYPVLGALPTVAGGGWLWVSAALVLVGGVAWRAAAGSMESWEASASIVMVATLMALVATAVVLAGTRGAIGPGALGSVGVEPAAAVRVAGWLLIGFILGAVWSGPWRGKRAARGPRPPTPSGARGSRVQTERRTPVAPRG